MYSCISHPPITSDQKAGQGIIWKMEAEERQPQSSLVEPLRSNYILRLQAMRFPRDNNRDTLPFNGAKYQFTIELDHTGYMRYDPIAISVQW